MPALWQGLGISQVSDLPDLSRIDLSQFGSYVHGQAVRAVMVPVSFVVHGIGPSGAYTSCGAAGDALVEDIATGERVAMPMADFREKYRPSRETSLMLAPVVDTVPGIRRGWLDVEAALATIVARMHELQRMRGACKETSEALSRAREAVFWLRERHPLVNVPEQDVVMRLRLPAAGPLEQAPSAAGGTVPSP